MKIFQDSAGGVVPAGSRTCARRVPGPAGGTGAERGTPHRGVRRRLFLGRGGRVRAPQGRNERRVRLFRRRAEDRQLHAGGHRQDRARGIRTGHLRPGQDQLRHAATGVLLRGARSHAAQLPGPGPRDAVPFGDLLRRRKPAESSGGVHPHVGTGQRFSPGRSSRSSCRWTPSTRRRSITRTTSGGTPASRTSCIGICPRSPSWKRSTRSCCDKTGVRTIAGGASSGRGKSKAPRPYLRR